VFACGNPSRGDDALGPALLERLAWSQAEGQLADCDLLTDFQLQVEHALDLVGRELVVFVDASLSGPEPFAFTLIRPEPVLTYSTHAMTPGAVLRTFAQLAPQIAPGPCPTAWLLAIRGYRFELGEALSAAAQANLDASGAFLDAYLRDR
jgi:hydrogenase maturation protease